MYRVVFMLGLAFFILLINSRSSFGRSYAVGQFYRRGMHKNGLQITSEGKRALEHWRLNYVEYDDLVGRVVVDFSLAGVQFLDLYSSSEGVPVIRLYSGLGVGQFRSVTQPKLYNLHVALPLGLRFFLQVTERASLIGLLEYYVMLGNYLVL